MVARGIAATGRRAVRHAGARGFRSNFPIITSDDLITAETLSPTPNASSSTASLVIDQARGKLALDIRWSNPLVVGFDPDRGPLGRDHPVGRGLDRGRLYRDCGRRRGTPTRCRLYTTSVLTAAITATASWAAAASQVVMTPRAINQSGAASAS